MTSKSSKEIKVGDTISINRRTRTTVVRVVSVPDKKQVSKAAAPDLFTLISDEPSGSA